MAATVIIVYDLHLRIIKILIAFEQCLTKNEWNFMELLEEVTEMDCSPCWAFDTKI